jgi:tetratricopeptide (TPR) repeat protein
MFISIGLLQLTEHIKHKAAVCACNQGNHLFVWGLFQEAIQSYQEALSLNPNNADAQRGMLISTGIIETIKNRKQREHSYKCYEYN